MSPQAPRYPNPVSGDTSDAGGRHRRPRSLVVPAPRPGGFTDGFLESGFADAQPISRRSVAPSSFTRRDDTQPGRHAASPRGGSPVAGAKPPVTGVHRAPGTLPLETLLRVGKGRQQILLASLIVVGLLVVAVPAQQRRDGVDAVNAAAQRVIGGPAAQTRPKTRATKPSGSRDKSAPGRATTGSTPTASPTAGASPATQKPAATGAAVPVLGHGPGRSLRTTGTSAVALTFDDGPDPVQTPRILALLAKYRVKATFCLVGQQVQRHPEIVRQIVAAGHTLCNHTWDHSLTIGQDKPEQIQQDLARTNAAIRAAVPDATIPFFRAPGGNFSDQLVTVAAGDGMASLYWQVDPRDWDHPIGENDAEHITKVISAVRDHVRPGSIILSHDFNQPDTITAYQTLLPWLTRNFKIGLPDTTVPATTTPTTAPATTAPATTAPTPSAPATSAPAVAVSPPASAPAAP